MRSPPMRRPLTAMLCAAGFVAAVACGAFKNDKSGGGASGGDSGPGADGAGSSSGAGSSGGASSSGGTGSSGGASSSGGTGSSGGASSSGGTSSSGGCQGSSCVTTLVFFGGDENSPILPTTDTWTSDGSSWKNPTTKHAPSHRESAAIAMLGGKAILFGGSPTGQGDVVGETWSWDGTDWTQLQPAHTPTPRSSAAVATVGSTIVLYGGTDGQNLLSETWTFDGNDWTQHVVAGPGPLEAATMAELGGEGILFGGLGGSDGNTELANTWIWSGSSWAQKTTAHAPSARDSGLAATVGSVIVLFSGIDTQANSPADTYTFDGTDWTDVTNPAQAPPGRYGAAFGVLGGQLFVVGGATQPSGNPVPDSWVWTGTQWIVGSIGPSGRSNAAMIGPD